jgi:hypothetical protein
MLSSPSFDTVKIFIFIIFFYCAFFTSKKYVQNSLYRLKAVKVGYGDKEHDKTNQAFNSDDPSRGRKFDSILSLKLGFILLPVSVRLMELVGSQGKEFFIFTAKVRVVSFFAFLNQLVSLKRQESLYVLKISPNY